MLEKIWKFLRRSPSIAASPAAHDPIDTGPEVVSHSIPNKDLDEDAVKIVQRLTRFRHEAYLVGGCVRDLLLGLRPKDFDIATAATPRQVKRLFRNSRIIGRRFRLAHVFFAGGKIIEVATFRSREEDAEPTADGDVMIRDDNRFGTPAEDALRRDFTINQLFYDVGAGKVIDHAGGLADLKRRLVRTIGEPELRFREDPIRILRAIKFAARLDLQIEEQTLRALKATRSDIPKAAAPRVLEEINRFCHGGRARRSFELLFECGVFQVILPEFHKLYGGRDARHALLLDILEAMDRQTAKGQVPMTGEILAALVLAGTSSEMGWTADGKANQPQGFNPRDLVDDTLRPVAVRLRISRRDQEICRQIVMTLFRMVPHQEIRRNTKAAILKRQSLPSAIWILEALGRVLGGDFATAAEFWGKQRPDRSAPPTTQRAQDPDVENEDSASRPRSRSRGRRGGRGRGRSRTQGEEPTGSVPRAANDGKQPQRRESTPTKDKTSPPRPRPSGDGWDDDYFFSALPTVPDLDSDGDAPNRYGSAIKTDPENSPGPRSNVNEDEEREASSAGGEASSTDGEASGEERRPRRRRRRRRPANASTEDNDS